MSDTGHESDAARPGDRRGQDRRVRSEPIAHADRRAQQRRSGRDRRSENRARLT